MTQKRAYRSTTSLVCGIRDVKSNHLISLQELAVPVTHTPTSRMQWSERKQRSWPSKREYINQVPFVQAPADLCESTRWQGLSPAGSVSTHEPPRDDLIWSCLLLTAGNYCLWELPSTNTGHSCTAQLVHQMGGIRLTESLKENRSSLPIHISPFTLDFNLHRSECS